MKLKKKVIVFGAGKNGEKLLEYLGNNILLFCDNKKTGMMKEKVKIINFFELKNMDIEKYDVILSVDSDDMRRQLCDTRINWYEYSIFSNNFFNQSDIIEMIDNEYFSKYEVLTEYISNEEEVLTGRGRANWFRDTYISDVNQELVVAMLKNNEKKVCEILSSLYDSNEDRVYEDELFKNRPGMRLIDKIIKIYAINNKKYFKVCDFGCGHGSFLQMMQSDNILCYGVDNSIYRSQSLNQKGIECHTTSVEKSGFSDEIFDYVTVMECLEHVKDPFKVMDEAYRVLKKEGEVFVTVPYGTNNDSVMHVRHFYEDDLYFVAKNCGFKDIKIMKIGYVNFSYEDNLFMIAKKV